MRNFNPAKHPRTARGLFSQKSHGEPDVSLSASATDTPDRSGWSVVSLGEDGEYRVHDSGLTLVDAAALRDWLGAGNHPRTYRIEADGYGINSRTADDF